MFWPIALLLFISSKESWCDHLRPKRSETSALETTTLSPTPTTPSTSPLTSSTLLTSTNETIGIHNLSGLPFENEPEIVTISEETIDLRIFPVKRHLLDQVQAYYVTVEILHDADPPGTITNSSTAKTQAISNRNYSLNYQQSMDLRLPYYAAIKLLPNQLDHPMDITIGNNDDHNGNKDKTPTEVITNYLNPPLEKNKQYRFGLAALMTDKTFLFLQSSRSIILFSTELGLIKSLIALFVGLIVVLIVIISGLIYYLKEAEVDVHWHDVLMIWSKRHRSSLFKDKNRSYKRCEDYNRSTITTNKLTKKGNKYLSGTLGNPLYSNSYINMEVEHRVIDLMTLVDHLSDPTFTSTLQSEFNGIPFIQMPSVEGTKAENRKKNRYVYLPAYDFNRVKLVVDDDEKEPSVDENVNQSNHFETGNGKGDDLSAATINCKPTDYINASYIDGYNERCKCYIATQGPLTWTFNDFWKMMWQQDCCQIVMLTGLFENGRVKCNQYWPGDGESISYGKIKVEHLSTNSEPADYVIRRFKMTRADESKEVILYNYVNWPDHGAPNDPQPLLNLMETIDYDLKHLPSEGPLVVHCSAGVGRTGTYIMIDIMKKMGLHENRVDILGQLYLLRKQRTHMIETEDQYYFVHQALARYFTDYIPTSEKNVDGKQKITLNAKQSSANVPVINIDTSDETSIEP